jgi:hypothetical protein
MYFPDFDEGEVVLDVDSLIIACVSDVLIGFGEILAEGSVGVDDGEFGGFPAELASADVEVPDGLGDEEVVILDLSVEVVGGDVEESLSSVEVEVHAVAL